jgi:multidrug efflux pump subunit AcrB
MDRYQRQAEQIVVDMPESKGVLSLIALGIGTPGIVNQGLVLAELVPPEERERSQKEIVGSLFPAFGKIPGLKAFAVEPSPMSGFSGSPVELVIQGPDVFELARVADEITSDANETGHFNQIRTDIFLNKPQLQVSIDRERASDLGMSVRDIATTLRILLGGLDISTFKRDGETYDVIAQLTSKERAGPSALMDLFVRGNGGLIPLAAVVQSEIATAPLAIPHYDRQRAITINAKLGPGVSQGDALTELYEIAELRLPPGGAYQVRYSGEAEKFFESGNALIFAYLLAILIVFLVLAAQFESFIDPLTILVAVFLSFTGAMVGLYVLKGEPGISLNIYSKIGIVMLVGIVTKNSILIVEFANQLRDRGVPLVEATAEACRTRFRPILMTATATMVGILPIAAGLGAGGSTRRGLGVAVIGGMLFSTLLTFFVVPATSILLARLRAVLARRFSSVEEQNAVPALQQRMAGDNH